MVQMAPPPTARPSASKSPRRVVAPPPPLSALGMSERRVSSPSMGARRVSSSSMGARRVSSPSLQRINRSPNPLNSRIRSVPPPPLTSFCNSVYVPTADEVADRAHHTPPLLSSPDPPRSSVDVRDAPSPTVPEHSGNVTNSGFDARSNKKGQNQSSTIALTNVHRPAEWWECDAVPLMSSPKKTTKKSADRMEEDDPFKIWCVAVARAVERST